MTTDPTVPFLPKRRRGRPRKNGSLHSIPSKPAFKKTQPVYEPVRSKSNPNTDTTSHQGVGSNSKSVDGMIGRMINGVIEGTFDAGYFVSMRMGNNGGIFRGVVFQPGKFIPITPANDVAPHAEMHTRRQIPVPLLHNLQSSEMNGAHKAISPHLLMEPRRCAPISPVAGNHRPQAVKNILMMTAPCEEVDQKSTHSAFGGRICSELTKDPKDESGQPAIELQKIPVLEQILPVLAEAAKNNDKLQHQIQDDYDELMDINTHQNLFSCQYSQPESTTFHGSTPNLELDLFSLIGYQNKRGLITQTESASAPEINANNLIAKNGENTSSSEILGFHQALLAGNPFLLHPDDDTMDHQSLEFTSMLEMSTYPMHNSWNTKAVETVEKDS